LSKWHRGNLLQKQAKSGLGPLKKGKEDENNNIEEMVD
jgi:hypothetical protein